MDIICRSRDPEKALRIAQGATSAPTSLKTGVGMNTLLEASDSRLQITTTDLSVAITTQIEATARRPGRASLLHALLYPISSSVNEPMTELATNRTHSTLICGSIRATMYGDRPEDFPNLELHRPDANVGRSVKASRLHSAIANAAAGGYPEGDQTASAVRGIPNPEIPETDPEHTQITIQAERFRNAVSASEALAKEGPQLVELTTLKTRNGTAELSIRVADALLGEIRDRVHGPWHPAPTPWS